MLLKCYATYFFRFGQPNKIITDQGREYVNALNDKLFTTFKIQHLISSAYHPQTNGQDERTNYSNQNYTWQTSEQIQMG